MNKNGESHRISSGGLAVFLAFAIGALLYYVLYQIIHILQISIYQSLGETLIGSSNIIIGLLALVLGLDFFAVDTFFTLIGKYNPEFYRRYYHDPVKFKINKNSFKKFKIILGGVVIFGICASWFFLNEYISLGNKYIVVSTKSFVSCRKQYGYSDIQITESPQSNGRKWVEYIFSDGTKLANIGFWDGITIRAIQNAQRKAGVKASDVKQTFPSPLNKRNPLAKIVGYLFMGSMFIFIPRILGKLFVKKSN